MEWIKTALVLLAGMGIMVTGLIEYLFIAFLVYLGVCLLVMITTAFINALKTHS